MSNETKPPAEGPRSADAASILCHGKPLIHVGAECGLPLGQRRAMAERIVAALNANEGLSAETLLQGRLGQGKSFTHFRPFYGKNCRQGHSLLTSSRPQ